MSYIYKIFNDINTKLYIGKTCFDIQKRFHEHCVDAFKPNQENRPLYSAIRKYGIENFYIELIEECSDAESAERESYWINYFNSYLNGYNATLGGDGKFLYDHLAIVESLKKNPSMQEVAQQFGCCVATVSNIAKKYQIKTENKGHVNVNKPKPIIQLDYKDNQIQVFESTVEAAKWCFEQKLCATLNSGVRGHIAECANGKRRTAYQYKWKYNLDC